MPAASAFLACSTQWNYAPSGVPSGLRYEGCMSVLRAEARARGEAGTAADNALLQLQVAERGFLQAVAERHKAARDE